MTFNKKEYNKKYRQEHKDEKKQWKVDLPTNEKEEYDILLKQHGIKKADFLRESFAKKKEELKMKRYIVDYEEEIMKNEKESTYEYQEDHYDVYNTLEEAQKAFDKFKGKVYFNRIEKKWLKTIVTLYETTVDEDGEFGDWEQLNGK